jgi:hypothetical protein
MYCAVSGNVRPWDLLMDILEEFRHVLYHLHDPEFFRVLEPTHEWLTLSSEKK